MQNASIFHNSFRDLSTKESRNSRETEQLSSLRKKNPKVTILNKRGRNKPNNLVGVKSVSEDEIKRLPKGFIISKLRDLRERDVAHDGRCRHSSELVFESLKLIYGDWNAGASVAKKKVVYEESIVAASSGYYLVDGEMVYLHSDGSICRISQDVENNTRCLCNMVHG
jgi:hypothetical protein